MFEYRATKLLYLAWFSEIQAFLCFAIFAQNSKWPPFLVVQIFFENWVSYSLTSLIGENIIATYSEKFPRATAYTCQI